MTTSDARKRNRDMADAHETARARDAAWMLAALDGGSPRTRTHLINPETGEFTPLDFHREWLYVMDTQRPHTPQETDMTDHRAEADVLMSTAWMETGDRVQTHALLAVHDTLKNIAGNSAEQYAMLTEILDRLPERETECGDVWRDETERPCTRPSGHDGNHVDKVGTIWANPEPTPHATGAAVEFTADIIEEPPVGSFPIGSLWTDCEGFIWRIAVDGPRHWWGYGWAEVPDTWPYFENKAPLRPTTDADRERVGLPVEPAPAGVDPDEALARVLYDMGWSDVPTMTDWIDVARAAREHLIGGEPSAR